MTDQLCMQINVTYEVKDKIECEEDKTSKRHVHVFKGLLNGTIPIALKRYQVSDDKIWKEVKEDLKILTSPNNTHVNFIRYFGSYPNIESDEKNPKDQFNFIAMEWCECSVADIIDPDRKEIAKKKTELFDSIVAGLPHKEILRQTSEAVVFLHKKLEKIHRNLHPDNILIYCVDPTKNYFLIKLTDFQFSKDFKINSNNTGTKRKDGWVAPESFKVGAVLTTKLDYFLLGCFYYYVLHEGKHPFEEMDPTRQIDIERIQNKDDKVYSSAWNGNEQSTTPPKFGSIKNIHLQEEAGWAMDMIKGLIKYDPTKRTSVEAILEGKYFTPESYVIYGTNLIPGLCVIVTQEMHYNPEADLDFQDDYSGGKYDGVSLDAIELEKTFKSFGYDILRFRNLRTEELKKMLTPKELTNQIKKDGGKKSFANYASLVICYLGHGSRGAVCGVDCDGKNNLPVSLNRIQYGFNDESCPVLSGKPKIFIILACQGDLEQTLREDNYYYRPSAAGSASMDTSSPSNDNKIIEHRPILYDFIRLSSTIEEYVSYTYFGQGSIFIQSLCSALANEYKNVNSSGSSNGIATRQTKQLRNSAGRVCKKIARKRPVKRPKKAQKVGSIQALPKARNTPSPVLSGRNEERYKKDLTQLFTTFVTPSVGLSGGRIRQTPEFRSSLSKMIRFRTTDTSGILLKNGCYDGEKTDPETFRTARKKWEDKGYKKKKLISDSDYEFLLRTILGEARGKEKEVQQAVAWVILNRYNLNKVEWGGNNSLKDVCNKFKQNWSSPLKATDNIVKWITRSIYDSNKDPTLGATYFKVEGKNESKQMTIPEKCRKTATIGKYQFFKDPPQQYQFWSHINSCNIF